MNTHQARLQAMLDNTGGSWPSLNSDDKEAICWLLEYAAKLEGDIYKARQETIKAMDENIRMRQAAEKASADFMRVAVFHLR